MGIGNTRHGRMKVAVTGLNLVLAALLALAGMGRLAKAQASTASSPTDSASARAPATAPAVIPASMTPAPIAYEQETLDNGLRVIYAPLHQAPVIHVRVLYHVGSRDEKPDRQGFAHMFEHMMFRGSAHVAPQQHMKLIGIVGGYCNAFTSFDQTVYHDTIPSNQLALALWLEADRMSSFKVSEDIFKTERKVVAEEWRIGENKPYGTMYKDFLRTAFVSHSYRWTPIGNMQQLQNARVSELQDFFNTYYIPNNAVLVIAGDFQVQTAKAMVHKYFAWIPAGAPIHRDIPTEPPQTKQREAESPQHVPLPAVMLGYHTPPFDSDDNYALELLGDILGDGRSSRLQELLVNNASPQCVNVSAGDWTLEDAGEFILSATVMQGRDAKAVGQILQKAVADICEKGVTPEELDKAKTEELVSIVKGRETAQDLASQLGEQALFANNPERANTELAKLDAVTAADILNVARKYLKADNSTILFVKPDPLGIAARAAAKANEEAAAASNANVAPSTQAVAPRPVTFPQGYPTTAPVADVQGVPEFKKGTELNVNGVRVIVMTDNRLPLVTWSLTMRHGSNSEAAGKEGVAGMTAEMLRRGTAEQTYAQLSQDLDDHGITISVNDGGDFTRLAGSCTSEELPHSIQRAHEMLLQPKFDAEDFAKVKKQLMNQLLQAQETPRTVASDEYDRALYGDTPLGRYATPQTVATVTLEDVKKFYDTFYRPNDAILILAGDVTVERGKELAEKLLASWQAGSPPDVDYTLPPAAQKARVILIDNPDAKQAVIHLGVRAYDIHSDEKYAGSLAGQILSSGIDSRLMEYVRAEKGLVYGIGGYFGPGRHGGDFSVTTDTRVEATGETIASALKVLDDMEKTDVTPTELSQAKLRVAGSMALAMQTIDTQAARRVEGVMNGYPLDYYDRYPSRVAQVSADQVKDVMDKYVHDDRLLIVVVAPADVKKQLEQFGSVEVLPMPAKRAGAVTAPSNEMLH